MSAATEGDDSAVPESGFLATASQFGGTVGFVFLSSMVMVMASERVYWYWAANPKDFCFGVFDWWGLGVWYCLPTLAGLWALGCSQATKWYQVVLAASVYAFITEGIITPIMYEGGLFDPFMPAMFLGWHGMLAMFGFWYLTRLLIAKRSRGALSASAVVAGLVWGVWATTSWLPENAADLEMVEDDGWSTAILGAGDFALYALTVGLVFAGSHWLLARAWPKDFRPRRSSTVFVITLNGLLFVPMAIAIPWAPLKFGFFSGLALWALYSSRRGNQGPTVFEQLAGRSSVMDIAPLMLMPVVAAGVYAGIEALNPSEESLRTYAYFGLVWLQVVAGGIAFVWALVKSFHTTGVEHDFHPSTSPDTH